MPDLLDRIYCSEQIFVPPTFPYIMKMYCKSAIRTQPYDLLRWSASYFRALANGEEPPVKERIEFPPFESTTGITPGYIRILIRQFGKNPETLVTAQTLFKKWNDICLQEYLLIKIIALLGAATAVSWVKFVAVCAGFISKSLTHTMILICELFTDEPEGGMSTIPYELFIDLYMFLAQMECGPLTDKEKEEQEAIMVEEDICEIAEKIKQGLYDSEEERGMVMEEEYYSEGKGGSYEYVEEEKVGEGEEEKGNESPPEDVDEESQEILSKGSKTVSKSEEGRGDDKEEAEEEEKEKKPQVEEEEEEEEEEEDDLASDLVSEMERKSLGKMSMKSAMTRASQEGETPQVEGDEKGPSQQDLAKAEDRTKRQDKVDKKSKLEDLDEQIRARIEEKLEEEEGEESIFDEDNREFENLNSYLLGAATRVQKYTSEALGYKIFKKCMRQEVPGIGPYIDTEQIEKVVDFMDFWSHKQESMVMPRNIRHWMCPPLDRVDTPI